MNFIPMTGSTPRDLPSWLWLGLPLLYLAVLLLALAQGKAFYQAHFVGEFSVTELLTPLFLFSAMACGLHAALALRGRDKPLLMAWVLLGALGCFYFGGEEISWGQHLAGWATPGEWGGLNDQDETNLHNLAGLGPLLDQLPRSLLTLGAAVGGVIVPLWLLLARRRLQPGSLAYWIWPTLACTPAALLAVLSGSTIRKIVLALGYTWPAYNIAIGEVKELYLALFLLFYLASFDLRLRRYLASGQTL